MCVRPCVRRESINQVVLDRVVVISDRVSVHFTDKQDISKVTLSTARLKNIRKKVNLYYLHNCQDYHWIVKLVEKLSSRELHAYFPDNNIPSCPLKLRKISTKGF